MEPLLELENVETWTPDGLPLSSALSLQLRPGEVLAIQGPNGAGKTTLLRTLLGLHRHHRGQVHTSLRAEEIAYLPQLGNVRFFLPLTLHDVITMNGSYSIERITAVGLLEPAILDRPWNGASGGERQRALLTRLFLAGAKLLVLDEPYNHLDAKTRAPLRDRLEREVARGAALIVISHVPLDLPGTRTLRLGGEA